MLGYKLDIEIQVNGSRAFGIDFFSIMEVKVPPYSDIQLDATWEFEKVTVLEQELYP